MRFLPLLLLAGIFAGASAQPLIVDDGVVLRRGIYRNFEEFRQNKPSITLGFEVDDKIKGYGFLRLRHHHIYKLVLNDPNALGIQDSVWGFCDGKAVYISNDISHVYKKRNEYDRLLFMGRYCLFETVIKPRPTLQKSMTSDYTVSQHDRRLLQIGLDFNTNDAFWLDKRRLRAILRTDPELAHQFNRQLLKKKKLAKYLILYAQRHREEIGRRW